MLCNDASLSEDNDQWKIQGASTEGELVTLAVKTGLNQHFCQTLILTLALEPAEANVMRRPPRNPNESILSGFLIWRIIFVSLIIVAGTFWLFVWEWEHGASIELARTVAVNTLVIFEIFYLFNSRYPLAPSLTYG